MSQNETFWLTVLAQVQLTFILIGVVIFMTIPRSGKREFIEIGLILLASLATEVIAAIGAHVFHTNPNLVANIFNIVNLPLAVLLYKKRFHWKNIATISHSVIILFVLFGVLNLFLIQGVFNYNSYTTSLASICFVVISLLYFYVLVQQLPTESITKLPMFWINTAILIYYSGAFVIYLSRDYLVNVLKDNLIGYWLIHNSLGLLFYAMLWYGCWLIRSEYLPKKVPA